MKAQASLGVLQMDEYEVQVALALQASKREAKEAAARNKQKADRRRTVEEAELLRAQRVSLRATGSDVCRHADALSFKYWESDSCVPSSLLPIFSGLLHRLLPS